MCELERVMEIGDFRTALQQIAVIEERSGNYGIGEVYLGEQYHRRENSKRISELLLAGIETLHDGRNRVKEFLQNEITKVSFCRSLPPKEQKNDIEKMSEDEIVEYARDHSRDVMVYLVPRARDGDMKSIRVLQKLHSFKSI